MMGAVMTGAGFGRGCGKSAEGENGGEGKTGGKCLVRHEESFLVIDWFRDA
jgi:hypothetical protein